MLSEETIGVLLVLVSIFFFGLQPVLSKYAVGFIHPLFLGALLALVGSIVPVPILLKKREINELVSKKNLAYLLLIAISGTVVTSILFLVGAQLTSGINASLLLQAEPIYATLLGFYILKEQVTGKQVFAMFLIMSGVGVIVYGGTLSSNLGDILILLTPIGWQLAHVTVKTIVKQTGTYVIAASRFLYAGIILLMLSTIFGVNQFDLLSQPHYFGLILFLGFMVAVGYILWVEALKRISLMKATTLIAPYPVISVIFAWFILSELPSVFQITGLIAIIIGMYIAGRIRSTGRN